MPKPSHPLHADWAKEIEDIRPLGSKTPPKTPAMPKMPAATGTPLKVKEDYLPITGWYDAPAIPVFSNTAECIAGADASMEKSLFKKLSQGLIHPQTVIDLHGLGEGDALLQLVDFLHAAVTRDIRCALIIHGKGTGYGAARNMGVIKSQIGAWLSIHPKVLAFHTAHPHDGGTGAIYVYLRRYGHSSL